VENILPSDADAGGGGRDGEVTCIAS
jgi:hypothetical protein